MRNYLEIISDIKDGKSVSKEEYVAASIFGNMFMLSMKNSLVDLPVSTPIHKKLKDLKLKVWEEAIRKPIDIALKININKER